MREINAYTLTTFKTLEEIQSTIHMNLLDVSFGIFRTRLSLLKKPAANKEWTAKSAMVGWSKDIIRRIIM